MEITAVSFLYQHTSCYASCAIYPLATRRKFMHLTKLMALFWIM